MFKDYLSNDIDKVFINTDEHGENVVINDISVKIIQDKDHLEYRLSKDMRGLLNGDLLFYISETEFSKIPNLKTNLKTPPRTGEVLKYNSKPATITDVKSNSGLYEIILEFAGAR